MKNSELQSLLRCRLFQNISPQEVSGLLNCLNASRMHFRKNEAVWQAGDEVRSCAVVLSGMLRAETMNAAGEQTLIALHRPGALVGDVLMATPDAASPVYVTAAQDSVLLFLSYRAIMDGCSECCSRHSLLRENLVGEIAQKYWVQRRRAVYLTAGSLRRKIALFLLDQTAEGLTFSLHQSREDLATFLGANRSALSRELSRMRSEGLLEFYRDTFRLLKPEALEAIRDI